MKKVIVSRLSVIHRDSIIEKNPNTLREKPNKLSIQKFEDISDLLLKSVLNKKKSAILERIVKNQLSTITSRDNLSSDIFKSRNPEEILSSIRINYSPLSGKRKTTEEMRSNNYYLKKKFLFNNEKLSNLESPKNKRNQNKQPKSRNFLLTTQSSNIDSLTDVKTTQLNLKSNENKNLTEIENKDNPKKDSRKFSQRSSKFDFKRISQGSENIKKLSYY